MENLYSLSMCVCGNINYCLFHNVIFQTHGLLIYQSTLHVVAYAYAHRVICHPVITALLESNKKQLYQLPNGSHAFMLDWLVTHTTKKNWTCIIPSMAWLTFSSTLSFLIVIAVLFSILLRIWCMQKKYIYKKISITAFKTSVRSLSR